MEPSDDERALFEQLEDVFSAVDADPESNLESLTLDALLDLKHEVTEYIRTLNRSSTLLHKKEGTLTRVTTRSHSNCVAAVTRKATMTTDKEFQAKVNSDIRDQAPQETRDFLRSAENIDRWILTLTILKRTTESQLSSYRATMAEARCLGHDKDTWMAFASEQERWRSDAIRFKNGAENKLDEAKYLRESKLARLVAAITEHRDGVDNAETTDIEIGQHDDKLWGVLDGI